MDLKEKEELALEGDFETLSEEGKYEVKKLTISGHDLVVRADFKLLKDAYSELFSPQVGKNGAAVNLDMIGAGDKILFKGAILNKELFMSKAKMRIAACQELGAWVAELIGEGLEGHEKKA